MPQIRLACSDAARADRWQRETILGWFRERAADLRPQDIERRLSELAEEIGLKPASNPARLVWLGKENTGLVRVQRCLRFIVPTISQESSKPSAAHSKRAHISITRRRCNFRAAIFASHRAFS